MIDEMNKGCITYYSNDNVKNQKKKKKKENITRNLTIQGRTKFKTSPMPSEITNLEPN